jgi:OPT family oligopeptide transporter
MALQHLTDEQTRKWTRAQKDQWWLDNVFRGDMPQLTARSALTGFLLGGILSATALYIAAKTGISIGVGLTSVLLSFGIYRALHGAGLARDFTILENNCTQSIATAAGYVIGPLISSFGAYMLVTDRIVPAWQMVVWMVIISTLGVLIAFPMKRRFINEDQLPFPEGRACGVVLDSLYTGGAAEGLFKTRLLMASASLAAVWAALTGDAWMKLIQMKILMLDRWAGLKEAWHIEDRIDSYFYAAAGKFHWATPAILGTDFRTLGLRLTVDLSMVGIGGLMGMAVATSCAIGGFLNFVVLAPFMIEHGDIVQRVTAAGKLVPISRAEIVNQWSMWWGVTMMVVGSFVGLLAKPELFTKAFKSVLGRRGKPADPGTDVLRHIEVPLWVSYVGVPVFSVIGAWVTHTFFGVPLLLSFVALPLIFVLTVICTNSMALTSWTPTGSLSKITQFTMGAIDRTNPASNLLPAGMTSEIASNAANLLSDIKPGYMLGGKPRHQVIGHVIGIVSGALTSVPLYFLLFLRPDANGVRSPSTMITDQFAFPAVVQWKGVAEIIAHGFSGLPHSAIVAVIVAAVAAVVIEVTRLVTRGRSGLSAVSIGLGVVLPPESTFMMWIGALMFFALRLRYPEPGTRGNNVWVEGLEPICAGLISGAALMGIGNAVIGVLLE